MPLAMELSVFDAEFRKDPYPILADLRRDGPAKLTEGLRTNVFTGHDHLRAILRDNELWKDGR